MQAARRQSGNGKGEPENIMNLPNILTFLRLILVPVLLILFEWNWKWSPITAAIVFIVAALTDWLDGYLARKARMKSDPTVAPCIHEPMQPPQVHAHYFREIVQILPVHQLNSPACCCCSSKLRQYLELSSTP